MTIQNPDNTQYEYHNGILRGPRDLRELYRLVSYAVSLQEELRLDEYAENEILIKGMGGAALLNEALKSIGTDLITITSSRVFLPAKYAPAGMRDLGGWHEVTGEIDRFMFHEIMEKPTFSLKTADSRINRNMHPRASEIFSDGSSLALPVKTIELINEN
jgi:hypothetical protein